MLRLSASRAYFPLLRFGFGSCGIWNDRRQCLWMESTVARTNRKPFSTGEFLIWPVYLEFRLVIFIFPKLFGRDPHFHSDDQGYRHTGSKNKLEIPFFARPNIYYTPKGAADSSLGIATR